jgi:hypothetical protein
MQSLAGAATVGAIALGCRESYRDRRHRGHLRNTLKNKLGRNQGRRVEPSRHAADSRACQEGAHNLAELSHS